MAAPAGCSGPGSGTSCVVSTATCHRLPRDVSGSVKSSGSQCALAIRKKLWSRMRSPRRPELLIASPLRNTASDLAKPADQSSSDISPPSGLSIGGAQHLRHVGVAHRESLHVHLVDHGLVDRTVERAIAPQENAGSITTDWATKGALSRPSGCRSSPSAPMR